MSDLNTMKYNDLQKLAKSKGLLGSGTKEELIARLSEADGSVSSDDKTEDDTGKTDGETSDTDEEEGESSDSDEDKEGEEEKPQPSKKEERQSQQNADVALREDAKKMKEALDKQKKVSIMIPFDVGVDPKQAKNIPFHINLNGYVMDLPRGTYIDVPEQVAQVIKERLESEGKIGGEWRIDANHQKHSALT